MLQSLYSSLTKQIDAVQVIDLAEFDQQFKFVPKEQAFIGFTCEELQIEGRSELSLGTCFISSNYLTYSGPGAQVTLPLRNIETLAQKSREELQGIEVKMRNGNRYMLWGVSEIEKIGDFLLRAREKASTPARLLTELPVSTALSARRPVGAAGAAEFTIDDDDDDDEFEIGGDDSGIAIGDTKTESQGRDSIHLDLSKSVEIDAELESLGIK